MPEINCPHCKKNDMLTPESFDLVLGKRVQCRHCKQVFTAARPGAFRPREFESKSIMETAENIAIRCAVVVLIVGLTIASAIYSGIGIGVLVLIGSVGLVMLVQLTNLVRRIAETLEKA